jgi:hypothetical protein
MAQFTLAPADGWIGSPLAGLAEEASAQGIGNVAIRRRGVAKALAEKLINHGFQFTTTLTCNAKASAAAPLFWKAMGFVQVEVPGITHMRLATATT